MEKNATNAQVDTVIAVIEKAGFTARSIPGGDRVSIGVLNNEGPVDPGLFIGLPGVKDAVAVTKPYKLVSREVRPTNTVVTVGEVTIGDGRPVIMAGPCAIESETQALTIARLVHAAGAHLFRGGAFKPRTSPYTFQGLGEEGLKIMAKVREETGMPVVTEVMDTATVDLVAAYTDIIQIGTRNMQNFSLLRRAGQAAKPILLKRGMSATLDEWLMAAEYILQAGNNDV
ncbi:MAG: N-acetylneuraminate synthase family protein, partial [Desulfosarcinaceae bacterium]